MSNSRKRVLSDRSGAAVAKTAKNGKAADLLEDNDSALEVYSNAIYKLVAESLDPVDTIGSVRLLLSKWQLRGLACTSKLLCHELLCNKFQVDVFWIMHLHGLLLFEEYLLFINAERVVDFVRECYLRAADDIERSTFASIAADILTYVFRASCGALEASGTSSHVELVDKAAILLDGMVLSGNSSDIVIGCSDMQIFADMIATISCCGSGKSVEEFQVRQLVRLLSRRLRVTYAISNQERNPLHALLLLRIPAGIFHRAIEQLLRTAASKTDTPAASTTPSISGSCALDHSTIFGLNIATEPGVHSVLQLLLESSESDCLAIWRNSIPADLTTFSTGAGSSGIGDIIIPTAVSDASLDDGRAFPLKGTLTLSSVLTVALVSAKIGISEGFHTLWLRSLCLVESVAAAAQTIAPERFLTAGSGGAGNGANVNILAEWLDVVLGTRNGYNLPTDTGSSGIGGSSSETPSAAGGDNTVAGAATMLQPSPHAAVTNERALAFVCHTLCECVQYQSQETLITIYQALRSRRALNKDAVDDYLNVARRRLREIEVLKSSGTSNDIMGNNANTPLITLEAHRVDSWAQTLQRTGVLPAAVPSIVQLHGIYGWKGFFRAMKVLCTSNPILRDRCCEIVAALSKTNPSICPPEEARIFIDGGKSAEGKIDTLLSELSLAAGLFASAKEVISVFVSAFETAAEGSVFKDDSASLFLGILRTHCGRLFNLSGTGSSEAASSSGASGTRVRRVQLSSTIAGVVMQLLVEINRQVALQQLHTAIAGTNQTAAADGAAKVDIATTQGYLRTWLQWLRSAFGIFSSCCMTEVVAVVSSFVFTYIETKIGQHRSRSRATPGTEYTMSVLSLLVSIANDDMLAAFFDTLLRRASAFAANLKVSSVRILFALDELLCSALLWKKAAGKHNSPTDAAATSSSSTLRPLRDRHHAAAVRLATDVPLLTVAYVLIHESINFSATPPPSAQRTADDLYDDLLGIEDTMLQQRRQHQQAAAATEISPSAYVEALAALLPSKTIAFLLKWDSVYANALIPYREFHSRSLRFTRVFRLINALAVCSSSSGELLSDGKVYAGADNSHSHAQDLQATSAVTGSDDLDVRDLSKLLNNSIDCYSMVAESCTALSSDYMGDMSGNDIPVVLPQARDSAYLLLQCILMPLSTLSRNMSQVVNTWMSIVRKDLSVCDPRSLRYAVLIDATIKVLRICREVEVHCRANPHAAEQSPASSTPAASAPIVAVNNGSLVDEQHLILGLHIESSHWLTTWAIWLYMLVHSKAAAAATAATITDPPQLRLHLDNLKRDILDSARWLEQETMLPLPPTMSSRMSRPSSSSIAFPLVVCADVTAAFRELDRGPQKDIGSNTTPGIGGVDSQGVQHRRGNQWIVKAIVGVMEELINKACSRVNNYEVEASPSQSEMQLPPSESPLAKLLNDDFLLDICADAPRSSQRVAQVLGYSLLFCVAARMSHAGEGVSVLRAVVDEITRFSSIQLTGSTQQQQEVHGRNTTTDECATKFVSQFMVSLLCACLLVSVPHASLTCFLPSSESSNRTTGSSTSTGSALSGIQRLSSGSVRDILVMIRQRISKTISNADDGNNDRGVNNPGSSAREDESQGQVILLLRRLVAAELSSVQPPPIVKGALACLEEL